MDKMKVGVVGYCPPTVFDEEEALKMIKDAYDKVQEQFPDMEIEIVSGLTNVGVLKIAYNEAVKRGWSTVGIACKRAEEHELFPVDEKMIVGENWGEESETFLSYIQAIIRIGVGPQSITEANTAKDQGKPAFEYDLPVLEV